MNLKLKEVNHQVNLLYADAEEAFKFLFDYCQVKNVYSYQESGIEKSWSRDKRVKILFNKNNVSWKEFQRDGIARGIKNRNGWDRQWYATMNQPVLVNNFSQGKSINVKHAFNLPIDLENDLLQYPNFFQPAGEVNAWKYLNSFTIGRGFNYARHISKPTESRLSGGRVSPFLAWGNLSIKQVLYFVVDHQNYDKHKRAFSGMMTRLKWHCHFIQKFEVECAYEHTCINRGYELLTHNNDHDKLAAWKQGRTGYPLVDACMRAVIATGWVNFRMRAMLVSFLCHHLDQDWRKGVYHLANQFLDYEPGIHFPQFQMQAGTTGIILREFSLKNGFQNYKKYL
jgi:deoxyribodipyrimidine photo-lyase